MDIISQCLINWLHIKLFVLIRFCLFHFGQALHRTLIPDVYWFCRLYQLNKCQLDFLQLNQSHPIFNYVISLMSINGQFPICLWNHFRDERPRTNNVFELILVLRKEQIHTETMIMQKEGELQPVKKQKRDVSINGRLYDDHGPQKKQNH